MTTKKKIPAKDAISNLQKELQDLSKLNSDQALELAETTQSLEGVISAYAALRSNKYPAYSSTKATFVVNPPVCRECLQLKRDKDNLKRKLENTQIRLLKLEASIINGIRVRYDASGKFYGFSKDVPLRQANATIILDK